MTTNIRIRRVHELGLKSARMRAEAFARSLREELQIDYEWSGNRLVFKRVGAAGTFDVGADFIDLDIVLGLPLSFMAGAIEKNINERLDAALS
ncbi:MAG: polyhydroxyalkanoic acid system family protein [Candidatus Thiosymbion ectosymbiont of Robbea hypermnestra]|nr:polyhydroxyalkanoic acid system family protein [Candidatus Thiosymbion ectosymbiont of Robbea hypermnestra]